MPALAVPPGTDISNVAVATFDLGGAPVVVSSNIEVTTTVAARTSGALEFLRYDPSLGTPENVDSGQLCSTSGATGGPYVPMPNPTDGSGSNLDLSSPLPLRSGVMFMAGDPAFARVTDLDQNLDPLVVESVELRYSVAATGDVEVARLYETGPDTGVFTGSMMLAGPPASAGDCELAVLQDSSVLVEYVDPADVTDISRASALVDPAGVVFDTGTGVLLDGVSISLVDASTGNPATVYGDDGLSSYPATVVTGTSATDGSGTIYTFSPGQYRFPLLQPGSYRLVVQPPTVYRSPSSVPTSAIQGLPGAPFNIVPGSRGESFAVGAGASVDIDVPLDVETSGLFANKLASKSHVEAGEFLEYRVNVSSGLGTAPAIGSVLIDRLPLGFRYQEGSGRLSDGTPIEPTISQQGRELRFDLGDMLPGDSLDVSYVAAVTQASRPKVAINTAVLITQNGLSSNIATASVTVVEDRLANRVLLMGRVTLDECGEDIDPWEAGVPAVRLYLEDGTFVVTDERGRFHIEGVRAGVHILQLDEATLPESYEPVSCNGDSAYARQPLSQFVDAKAGTMWRTDFHLRRKRGQLGHQLRVEEAEGVVKSSLDVSIGDVGVEKLSAVIVLPDGFELVEGSVLVDGRAADAKLVAGALSVALPEPEADRRFAIEFSATHGADAAAPGGESVIRALLMGTGLGGKALRSEIAEVAMPAAEVPAAAASDQLTLTLVAPLADLTKRLPSPEPEEVRLEDRFDKYWLDTQEPGHRWVYPDEGFIPGIASLKLAVIHGPGQVAELRRDGERVSGLNHDGTLYDEDKKIAMSRWRGVDLDDGANHFEVVFLEDGVEHGRIERTIHFTGGPVTAELVPEASTLVADGLTHPVIAVRMKDRAGRLVREGVSGQFRVDTPYQSRQEVDELRRTALTRLEEIKPTFVVGKDGIAKIELHPTSVVGQAKISFRFDVDHEREVSAWLSPGDRDWILVAVANGDLGYNDQGGNQDLLNEHGYESGFFQEGRIAFFAKGKVTGDWILTVAYDSDKEDEEIGRRLKQVIDPDEYFTLYGDSTQQGYDAASSGPVYVKIEREKFYALYGDYETSLNQTELVAYNRTLTGMKTEYYGDRLRVNGFVSETDQFFQRDEIRGAGTSGLYRLSYDKIVFGSDKVSIQTRDRFRSEVILEEVRLISGVDYNINFLDATLFFRQPILSRDKDLNPIYIVAEYEVESGSFEDLNGGGRVAARFQDGDIEIGASVIHQEAGQQRGDLVGVDGRYQIGDTTEIRAEVAYSDTETSEDESSGVGYLVEVEHTLSQTQARAYVREMPTDFGVGQQNLSELGARKYGVDLTHEFTPEWLAAAEFFRHENLDNHKVRNVFEINGRYHKNPYTGSLGLRQINADEENITQLLYGASRNFIDGRLDLYTSGEVGLHGGDSNGDYGDRFLLGSDFKINDRVTIFAQNEFLWTDGQDSIDTRGGFRVTPWRGATVNTTYTHETMENGTRGFANLGLTQTFNVGEHWSFSGSVDRSQTVLKEGFELFDEDVPLMTTGDATEDFTATSIGAAYNKNGLSTTGRFENRVSDSETNWGVFLSALQEHGERTSYGGNLEFFFDDRNDGSQSYESRLRLSFAHRPDDSRWILLNRLDFELFQEQSLNFETRMRRIVDHFKANHQMTDKLQVAYQLGLKYVVDTINGEDYDTVGAIFGLEARYNFRKNWDMSFHARNRHTFSDGTFDSNVGASLGYAVVRNVWVSVGYNFTGFYDDEFSAGQYTTHGPFIRFRASLDQTIVRDVLDRFRQR